MGRDAATEVRVEPAGDDCHFVTDAELIRRLHLPEKVGRAALKPKGGGR